MDVSFCLLREGSQKKSSQKWKKFNGEGGGEGVKGQENYGLVPLFVTFFGDPSLNRKWLNDVKDISNNS